jgi:hypothetical protein
MNEILELLQQNGCVLHHHYRSKNGTYHIHFQQEIALLPITIMIIANLSNNTISMYMHDNQIMYQMFITQNEDIILHHLKQLN